MNAEQRKELMDRLDKKFMLQEHLIQPLKRFILSEIERASIDKARELAERLRGKVMYRSEVEQALSEMESEKLKKYRELKGKNNG